MNAETANAPPDRAPSSALYVSSRPQSEADAECVAAVLAGNRERFAELIGRYQNAVAATVRGYIKDAHAVEDIAQDVFVNAFTALPQLRQPQLFYPWLLQIARHRAAQTGIRASRRPVEQPLTEPIIESIAPPDNNARLAVVMQSVEQLPEPYRQTVLLKYERGLSCKEIAAREKVAIGTITSRLTRALDILRTALSPEEKKSS